ncbi:MAG: hypothetical protein NFW16_04155 [Candidatus Accumulibacter sp.]|uniref:PIN domain-containing protein n=1 Tax=Accumulibacter sp. TaxID=2053492 RepID=UPI00258394EB|nr:hypothetical protein [Accumulibacter sp.]MCM8620940.1 hypothetical protein [Accumulibacter sp.]
MVRYDDVIETSPCIFKRCQQSERAFAPLVSRPDAEELLAVLADPKFSLSEAEQQDLLAHYLPWCETVQLPEKPTSLLNCRDADDKFLTFVAVAEGGALVSGDNELLALAGKTVFPVLDAETSQLRFVDPAAQTSPGTMILDSSVGPWLAWVKSRIGKGLRPLFATAPQFLLGVQETFEKSSLHSNLAAIPGYNCGIQVDRREP